MSVCIAVCGILYASETWEVTTRSMKRLDAFHHRCGRYIVGIIFDFYLIVNGTNPHQTKPVGRVHIPSDDYAVCESTTDLQFLFEFRSSSSERQSKSRVEKVDNRMIHVTHNAIPH